ncbi:MAG: FKBP-type peptidyl-prolyl cis-trans isomerase [Flavobacteriales bacterium]|jgi:FKBP-type peptidyl-prolyl cis-trans isomerase|nr:FKBP-type peptidyl-prolyl cis-trans isomerase [Flavobacteriales bacterium]
MKQNIFILLLLIPFLWNCGGDSEETEVPNNQPLELPLLEFNTFNERISYCIGLDHAHGCYLAYNSQNTKGKFDNDQIKKGMVDYLNDNELRIPLTSIDSLLNLYLLENGQVDETAVSKADASYAIGMSEGQFLVGSLVGRGIDQTVEVWFLVEGVRDGMSTQKPSVPYNEATVEVKKYYDEINLDMGESFLAANASADSVETTESGLQYKIIQEGNGIRPNLTDTCVVHYTGRFIDGRTFESTIPSKIPAELTPLGVIQGWQEGLQMMREGSQYRFFIPYQLGYGEEQNGPIPAYSVLVYDIELIKVKKFN